MAKDLLFRFGAHSDAGGPKGQGEGRSRRGGVEGGPHGRLTGLLSSATLLTALSSGIAVIEIYRKSFRFMRESWIALLFLVVVTSGIYMQMPNSVSGPTC